jgi:putative membrane protein
VIFWIGGNDDAGKALVIYTCLFMVLAGFVILRLRPASAQSHRGNGVGGAVTQSGPPLVARIAALLT